MNHWLRNLCVVLVLLLCAVAFGQQEAIDIVIDALKSNDPAMQAGAIALVRDIPGREITEALAKHLPNLPPAGQVQLLSAFADRADAAALPAVIKASDSADESVRIAALKAVGQLGDASSVSLLSGRAAQTSGEEQKAARESLYRLRGQQVDQAILAAIPSAQPDVKIELIQSVGERNIVPGIPVLLETAKDADPSTPLRDKVQRESFKVLKMVADAKFLPALVELLIKTKSQSVRGEAEKTVAAVAHKIEQKDRQAEAVLAALAQVVDVEARCSLLSVLGRIGDNSALPELRKALADDDAKIQDAAIRALSDWPNPAPVDDLLKVAKTSDNQVHRILALRGFVRLLGLETGRPAEEMIELYQQAMKLAPDVPEKRKVLSGLANTKSLAALEMAATCLQDSSLQQEAEVAVVKIAAGIYGSYPEKTKEVLAKIMQTSKSDSLREQAQNVINQIGRFEDYITAWQVSGPYTKEGADGSMLFDVAFAPEKPDPSSADWQIMPVGTNQDRPWLMELDRALGGDNRAAYLRTNVWSDKSRKVLLELGSDDGIKVWLNGQVVHANNATRPAGPGQDKVEVTLKQGWNPLLLKVTQGGGEWAVCARLCQLDGSKLDGLKYQAEK
jgi:HEAT repeat protein